VGLSGGGVRPKGKWGKWGKSDLKTGPGTAQLECVRTYRSTFDRTRAGAWCECA
jgi:hypothetical protein